ncbi:DNA methylase N-4/N-6 [uncultured Caudovirales phage]|uniref:DNA methylase N-4/N-6 n=1 Tax=uncultured Caudovirales phage TaxID=2100421 RepID=A0A6J5SPY2_9CAUD|nr:DNA methylase N-4/N-6 [uncultured Caudovirales phage]CAB4168010.1 DNA methylase N-4/N-6 [uncultured Caudovirales phage]CAB4174972.1 DNA methylase N-4/N-6 [uncultured Caudovirales phage]CAB4180686.1 DNA methylase N-4/N-6 [uncultured Caudovirales phage]CAB4186330.1 DNA methylase N-4/N-6 [uncultured Caudovirales phage]
MVDIFSEGNGWQIIHGDCREILGSLDSKSAIISDPPYGINWSPVQTLTKGRVGKHPPNKFVGESIIYGDKEIFDPSHLLSFPTIILFGANNFAHLLPPSRGWVVWDKKDGEKPMLFADCDMIYTNKDHPARLLTHRWVGYRRGPETGTPRLHPTQKPVALMRALIERYTKPGDLIVDPYMGSGTTLVAAIQCGRKAIGIEIDENYCQISTDRVKQAYFLGENEEDVSTT